MGNVNVKVVSATVDELAWLQHFLGVPDANTKFVAKSVPLFNSMYSTFPSGLLSMVQDEAKSQGFKVDVLDRRVRPCIPNFRDADLAWLSGFQDDAVEAGALAERGVFDCPTASGKGEIIAALTAVIDCPWLILAHRSSIVEELANRIELRTGERPATVTANSYPRVLPRITVAMLQTLSAGLKAKDKRAEFVVTNARAVGCDEAHVLPAITFSRVMRAAKNAYYRFGFSGTPYARGDKRGIIVVAHVGPTIYKIENSVLIAEGHVARGFIRMKQFMHTPSTLATWDAVYEEKIVRNAARNALIVDLAAQAQKPAMISVHSLAHGHALVEALQARGVASTFVYGKRTPQQREAEVRRLEHGDIDVIVCNEVFQEGVNIPTLTTLINASARKAVIPVAQFTGRVARRRGRDGAVVKDEFFVYDFLDRGCGCYFRRKDSDERWFRHRSCRWLETHADERQSTYTALGHSVSYF